MTDAAPRAGARRAAELAAAQESVDRVHARVDELRALAARRLVAIEAEQLGPTFQEAYQRDVVAHHHAGRVRQLTFGDLEQVVFGRIDASDAESYAIGRLGVLDEEGDVILVDWRADAAEPFYRATAAEPMDVARRRIYVAEGRKVRDLDDELLDVAAADRLGLEAISGQGALLAALERTRTGHMRDIVATIQADQDKIIRAQVGGTLVVSGGPGTGKTVVALHRVAYLLYTQRERMAGRGVLVVGPSEAFSRYVERVLPALGEDRAVLRSLDGFLPHGLRTHGWDNPEVAAVSGSARMAEVCRRLLAASMPALPAQTRIAVDGLGVTVAAKDLAAARKKQLARVRSGEEGRRYHDRTSSAFEAMRNVLFTAWSRAWAESRVGDPDRRDVGFDEMLSGEPGYDELHRAFWPARTSLEVFDELSSGRVDLGGIAGDLLDTDERALLHDAWSSRATLTGDDVALIDELEALLGPTPREQRAAKRAAAERAAADGGIRLELDRQEATLEDAGPPIGSLRYDGYAHVVVDEAQDLSPMQWRMVSRRGAYASWTVVGDLAQRARTAEPRSWDEIAALIGRRQVQVSQLNVNYRTPEEVVELARAVLVAAGEDPDLAPTSVRSSGRPPNLVRSEDLTAAAVEATDAALGVTEGTVALIAPQGRVEGLAAALADRDARLSVLDPRTAKGLEYDEVVVVAPDEIIAASSVGGHALYVAVTRTTNGLTLVAAPHAEVPGAELCS